MWQKSNGFKSRHPNFSIKKIEGFVLVLNRMEISTEA
jgi:hypothetical protein